MVVLEEPQRVVQVDGDAWGRAVTQKLEADAHHQEVTPQEASCDECDCELLGLINQLGEAGTKQTKGIKTNKNLKVD